MTANIFPLSILATNLNNLRQNSPLVHCLTNEVVQEITANVLLALGASPAMIVAEEESASFAAFSDALLINVGTLYPQRAKAMLLAIEAINLANKVWVLDPVAVGFLEYRNNFVHELLDMQPKVIRGNASEVMFLAGNTASSRGVDSTSSSEDAIDSAIFLARRYKSIVALTGATDYVTDGETIYSLPWGNPIMTRIVGSGCALSAVVAAFLPKATNALDATASACALMSIAGEFACANSRGPGSFLPEFIDTLYLINADNLLEFTREKT